jgi:hypothetical protein
MVRRKTWRQRLIGPNIQTKRQLFYKFIQNRTDISHSLLTTIKADMPRTYSDIEWFNGKRDIIQRLLVTYAAIHKGDSYLQGFNYIMSILYYVFHGAEHAEADTWWCFARIVGLIRPMMPDFNVAWFHWLRNRWLKEFHEKLYKKRPTIQTVLRNEYERFSSLITIKWFMIWFAQTVAFEEIFDLWDFFIQLPPHALMQAYTLITLEIIIEAAPTITYQWSEQPTQLMHAILTLKVKKINTVLEKCRAKLK